jgi:AraC-like DNA-binding protein
MECEFDRGVNQELRAASWFMGDLRFEAMELSGQRWAWKPGHGLDNWRRNTLVLFLFESGVTEMEQNGLHLKLGEGALLLFDGSVKYTQVSGGNACGITLRVPKASLETRGQVLSSCEMFVADGTSPDVALLKSLISGAAAYGERCSLYGGKLFAEHLTDLMELVTDELTAPKRLMRSDVMLRKAKLFIDRNFGNEQIDVNFVASALGVSRRYLTKLFEREGTSVMRYLLQKRLARAKKMLTNSDAPLRISEIAWQCGFVSAAHFSRVFKKNYGASPTELQSSQLTDTEK